MNATSPFLITSMASIGAVPFTRHSMRRLTPDRHLAAHDLAAERGVEHDALTGGGVGRARAQRVEHGRGRVLGREHRGQSAELVAAHARVAGMPDVVVRRSDEPDAEAVLEVLLAEEVEGAVARGDLGQSLHRGVVAGPVAGLVRVRHDQHVVAVVGARADRVQSESSTGASCSGTRRREAASRK